MNLEPIFYDTETCGLHGPIVLLQYAVGINGPVKLVSLWKLTIGQAIAELETIINHPGGLVGFNMTFDHFHVVQMLTTLYLMSDWSLILEECVTEYALNEPKGRFGKCCKPVKCCDLMLHARKGPYQSTMDRSDIRIRRVPTQLAWPLAEELERRVKLKKIFFGRKKDKNAKCWQVYDIEEKDGTISKDFKDVVLKFAATSALKAIATDVFGLEEDSVLKFKDVELKDYPVECGYAPFALAVGTPDDWKGAWPEIIHRHITHWSWHPKAREYAELDVVYLQRLYPYFGSPELGDTDSELASMVACVRWRGFAVNIEELKELRTKTKTRNRKILSIEEAKGIPFLDMTEDKQGYYFKIPTSPAASRKYLEAVLSPMERMVLDGSTKKPILETLAKWRDCKSCDKFFKDGGDICDQCRGPLTKHPASIRATEILEARQSNYEVDFYDKILLAGRFHASSSIIGSLSGRMAGGGSAKGIEQGGSAKGDGLNPLGVKRTKEVRSKFPLADQGLVLCAGDFSSFEVTLAEALYNDPDLRTDLLSGKSIHALFGSFLYKNLTYEQIMESKGTGKDYYDVSKRTFFATLYGAEKDKIASVLNISVEEAAMGLHLFSQRYKKVGEYQSRVNNKCCSMRQPGGIGTKVEWNEPAEYSESMFGFKRYYTLENMITKALFGLACDPPKHWKEFKIKVIRRDRVQSAYGALQSSLYGAAFSLQASNKRSFQNHEIQASGSEITKDVQRRIWDIQPPGIGPWLVQPLSVHDEVQCPSHPSVIEKVNSVVKKTVESYRERVPLIQMDWKNNLQSWADK